MHTAAFIVAIRTNWHTINGSTSLKNYTQFYSLSLCLFMCCASDNFLKNLPEAENDTASRLSVFWLIPCFFFLPDLTGCHHIFSQLPTTSYSATTDLNTDLALSVPLRREREIPHPQLPPTTLQGRILPVSSVFRLPESALLFLPDSDTFRFSADQCPDWKTLLLAQRDGEPWHIDPSCQYRLGLSDKLYLQHLSVLWLGTSLILG